MFLTNSTPPNNLTKKNSKMTWSLATWSSTAVNRTKPIELGTSIESSPLADLSDELNFPLL